MDRPWFPRSVECDSALWRFRSEACTQRAHPTVLRVWHSWGLYAGRSLRELLRTGSTGFLAFHENFLAFSSALCSGTWADGYRTVRPLVSLMGDPHDQHAD